MRVLAHPVRLKLLEELSRKDRCVGELNAAIPIPQPLLSQHIAVLRRAGIVDCARQGAKRRYFPLRPTLTGGLVALLRKRHAARNGPQKPAERKKSRGKRSRARKRAR